MSNKARILLSSIRSWRPSYFFYNKSKTIDNRIAKFEYTLVRIGCVVMLAIMFLGFGDVVGRYLFSRPIIGVWEINGLMMVILICISWGYVQREKSHLKMDFLFNKYRPRAKAIMGLIASGITLVCFGIIAWQSTLIAITNWKSQALVSTILIKQAPFELVVPFGSLLFCIEIIRDILSNVSQMKARRSS